MPFYAIIPRASSQLNSHSILYIYFGQDFSLAKKLLLKALPVLVGNSFVGSTVSHFVMKSLVAGLIAESHLVVGTLFLEMPL